MDTTLAQIRTFGGNEFHKQFNCIYLCVYYILCTCVCMCVLCVHVCICVGVDVCMCVFVYINISASKDNFQKLFLSFQLEGPGNQTQLSRLGDGCYLYSLRQLTIPEIESINVNHGV